MAKDPAPGQGTTYDPADDKELVIEPTTNTVTEPDEVPQPTDPGNPRDPEVEELRRMVTELQAAMFKQGQAGAQAGANSDSQLTDRGIVGTHERYSLNPDDYPDPRERLANEPRLQPVAFKYNFELEYSFHPTRRYQTQDGRWQVEPQFDLELNRIMLDEETQEPTLGRYTVCRGIFFEDPESAITVAHEKGLPIDDSNEQDFLNEMRYLRMRDWLFDAFFPTLDTAPKKNKKDMVIGGKLVQYFEVNSEDSETIPFNQLDKKKKF